MKKTTTLLSIIFASAFISSAQVNLQQGLIASFNLNNNTLDGTTNALDLAAFGTNIFTKDRLGTSDAAILLDATYPDFLADTFANPLFGPGEVTLSVWVNLTNPGYDQKIAGKANIGAGYIMGVNGGKVDVEIWNLNPDHNDPTQYKRLKAGNVPSDIWTHIGMSYKANGYLKIFINGATVDSVAVANYALGSSTAYTFIVGGAPWEPQALNTDGAIDDLYLYDRQLSNAEVKALYQSGSAAGVFETATGNAPVIYPNPVVNGKLNLDFSKHNPKEVSIKVIDTFGRIVYTSLVNKPTTESLDMGKLNAGVYLVSFTNEFGTSTKKIVVE